MKTLEDAYSELRTELKRLDRLGAAKGILFWDTQVNMPSGSADLRGEELAAFSELLHRECSTPRLGELIANVEAHEINLSPEQAIVIKEARKDYDKITRIPPEFSARRAKAQNAGFQAWVKARKEDDFATFLPHLIENLELSQEEAKILEAEDPYNFWVNEFDPGMTTQVIEPLFAELAPKLKEMVSRIEASPKKPDVSIFKGFPIDQQKEFLLDVVRRFGFDFNRGRLDIAVHPFCGGHPLDTRMTTRYHEDNPLDSLSSSMHETGHALYEQGLPDEFAGTALGNAVGMAVHESQSRLWENQVGRSREFWSFFEPRFRETFATQLKGVGSDDLFLAINRVAVTPIRVDADEITYSLHIILRFELEKLLFRGKLAPKDLPDAWNEASTRILGYTPKNNAEGCLQDVHWSEGMFGYFPSYALGNLLAAQLWEKINETIPELPDQIRQAHFQPLLEWLRTHVHSKGRRFDTREFARTVTGKELSVEPLLRYLESRYLPLYS